MLKAAAILALACFGCGCEDPRIRDLVWEETLGQAKHHGFNYKATLRGALGGDAEDVKRLMKFSRLTDAAGGLGHGIVMMEVCASFGDTASAGLAAGLSAEERAALRATMKAGLSYSNRPDFKDTPLESILPELIRRLSR